jgi:hypothetical protein
MNYLHLILLELGDVSSSLKPTTPRGPGGLG